MVKLKEKNKRIISDLELFYQIKKDKTLIAVTGSNGKSTTCHIMDEILSKLLNYKCCGNIGIPTFNYANSNDPGYIIECSSYMLEYTYMFKPQIFIFLNIENHHLNAHKTFSNYLEAKLKPLKNMDQDDILIYNLDDRVLSKVLINYQIIKYTFSMSNEDATCYYKNGFIWLNKIPFIKTKNLILNDHHNIQNMMASLLGIVGTMKLNKNLTIDDMSRIYPQIREIIRNITTLPHRLETIYNHENLIIINDSKATNSFATIKAFESIILKYPKANLYWLAGGKKEKQDFSVLAQYKNKIYKGFYFGENADVINNVMLIPSFISKMLSESVSRVIEEVSQSVNTLNVILFSPASSSFDQFQNFEERGEKFKQYVNEILLPK